jgi:hypothetical protein
MVSLDNITSNKNMYDPVMYLWRRKHSAAPGTERTQWDASGGCVGAWYEAKVDAQLLEEEEGWRGRR